METYNKVWRAFFAFSLIAIAVQQFIYTGFRPVIMPPEPAFIGQSTFCMCVASILLILISIAIIAGINAHVVADYLGASLLLMLILFHIPYNIKHNLNNLGGWTDAFKMLALCGGTFIMATSLPTHKISGIDVVTEKPFCNHHDCFWHYAFCLPHICSNACTCMDPLPFILDLLCRHCPYRCRRGYRTPDKGKVSYYFIRHSSSSMAYPAPYTTRHRRST
jgi:uncharacterized membrane protein YphA (DoxX/SURF4 family)